MKTATCSIQPASHLATPLVERVHRTQAAISDARDRQVEQVIRRYLQDTGPDGSILGRIRTNTSTFPETARLRLFTYLRDRCPFIGHLIAGGPARWMDHGTIMASSGERRYLPPEEESIVAYFGILSTSDKILWMDGDGRLFLWRGDAHQTELDLAEAWAWWNQGLAWEDDSAHGDAWDRFADKILTALQRAD